MRAPSRIHPLVLGAAMFAAAAAPLPARAALTLPPGFRDTLVAGGYSLPTGFAFVPDPPGTRIRAIVLESKSHRLRLVSTTPVAPTVGTVPDVESGGGEQGLLSIAVDPRWPEKPFVYVHYTAVGQRIHLARFRLSGDLANTGTGSLTMDPASRYLLIDNIPDSTANHNGGATRFGPDSMLYLSLGEDTKSCPAQDTTSFLGKLLRVDVRGLPDTGPGPAPRSLLTPADNPHAASPDSTYRLVHSIGLRNPYRLHIDPVTGAIFIADVGQVSWEEIDFAPTATGANFGWPWREGPSPFVTCLQPPPSAFTNPLVAVPHAEARSIMSLDFYHAATGAAAPFPAEYEGDFFYGDYFTGFVRRIGFDGTQWVSKYAQGQPNSTDWATGAFQIVDGLVGRDGAWWYLIQSIDYTYFNGELRRVEWNGVPDTSLAVEPGAPPRLHFDAPVPNPARGGVRFAWRQPRAADARLAVYDAAGRRVRTLTNGARGAGGHTIEWDGLDAEGAASPAGMYLARLEVGADTQVRRVALTR